MLLIYGLRNIRGIVYHASAYQHELRVEPPCLLQDIEGAVDIYIIGFYRIIDALLNIDLCRQMDTQVKALSKQVSKQLPVPNIPYEELFQLRIEPEFLKIFLLPAG
ncbi:hypothetical protein ES707_07909 [subsurface metagenome]